MIDARELHPGYRRAFLDWMACAVAGYSEPAVQAARRTVGAGSVMTLGTAGHVLDFDDTYGPGLAHLSAATAPAALVTGAGAGATIGDVLIAYATGFEAMAAVARASHPALYETGWHPTAVTGTIGAATAAAGVLGLEPDATATAQHLALLSAAGLQAAFGGDGKSLQVGAAAASGVRAARLVAAGATASGRVRDAFATVYGGEWAQPGADLAIEENWIKAFPCCLQTHSSIEAAATADVDADGDILVTVHPRSRQAAPLDEVKSGLEAKFSIPYTVAYTILYGPPGVDDFRDVDPAAQGLATRVKIELDDSLSESAARFTWGPSHIVQVEAALGSPLRPMTDAQLEAKVNGLSGNRLTGVLADPDRPAAEILDLLTAP